MSATGAGSTARAEPPAELVARFKAALERLRPEGGRLGLAVSGGPDSMAMLLLAEAAIPGRFEVATVDHGLRPGSADECAMVARVCAEREISSEVLPVSVEAGNMQAMARRARYVALATWAERRGLSALATAHHADDQAETLLMRLNRGSGVSGLAGVREHAHVPTFDVAVVRPLLTFRRAELARVIEESSLAPVDDPSNADERFERARIRKALAGIAWLDPLMLAASAAHLADAAEALDAAANILWPESVTESRAEIRYRPSVPRAIELRIVERAIAHFGGVPRGGDVARLRDRLETGQGGNLAGALATVEGDEWVFRAEPPRKTMR